MLIETSTRSLCRAHSPSFFNQATFKTRRDKLLADLPDGSLIIIPNKKISIRSNDTEYKFKPDSDFYYLTGIDEPNSICVLKKENNNYVYILFVEPENKAREIWIGKGIGLKRAKSVYKADEAYSIHEFDKHLEELIQEAKYVYVPFGNDEALDLKITRLIGKLKKHNRASRKSPKGVFDPRDIVHSMRLIKEEPEIDCIQRAADISQKAYLLAMSNIRPGMFEHELEAIFDSVFRIYGGVGPAYNSIVGSGNNSTVLHYTKNSRRMQKRDLVLVDAGCEFDYYASDVTRTYPVGPQFTPAQQDIYNIVLEAEQKAIQKVKPGIKFTALYDAAVLVIVKGLKELKLLKGSIEKIIEKEEYKQFFMHKIGHWMGLDVHDVGPYIDDKGNSIRLRPGMVLTIEPGIYIPRSSTAPKHFKGIGIRIEDDVLVTPDGHRVLTEAIPK